MRLTCNGRTSGTASVTAQRVPPNNFMEQRVKAFCSEAGSVTLEPYDSECTSILLTETYLSSSLCTDPATPALVA